MLTPLALALVGCDGTGGPVLVGDGGPGDAASDAPPPDRERPRIEGSDPASGATDVATATSIEVRFSEPMAAGGTLSLTADGESVALSPLAWDGEATVLTVTPASPLPSHARVVLRLEDDFADVAGNTLAGPELIAFEVGDDVAPRVASSTPTNGDDAVSARLELVTIAFDETMDTTAGTVSLEGTPGSVVEVRWPDPYTLSIAVEGLAYETDYRVVLDGFVDASGNALDATVGLSDGALAFATGADVDPPRVTDSNPADGQVNVATLSADSMVVVFDEAMDVSITTVELDAAGTVVSLPGTWSTDGTTLTLPAAGFLSPDGPHALRVGALRDVAGNAVDPDVYLGGDGAIDFVTGADDRPPVAVFSEPVEGSSTRARWSTERILVVFDRAMDRTTSSLRVTSPAGDFDAAATWNLSGTELYVDVSGRLLSDRAYRVDLSAIRDLRGRVIDASDAYLGDGALDFRTAPGQGENCRDVLDVTSGTATATGHEWTIGAVQVGDRDGSSVGCAINAAYLSPDAVIHVVKTTPAASAGGTYLHVTATSATTDNLILHVLDGTCDPSTASTTQLECTGPNDDWDSWLDVGPGDYYLWVAHNGSGRAIDFAGATVSVEEVASIAEGERCDAPFTTSSSIHSVGSSGEHVWSLPARSGNAADMTVSMGDPSTVSCDADGRVGADVVVEVQKATSTSVLSLFAEPAAGASSLTSVSMEVLTACDPRSSTRTSLACETDIRTGTRRVDLRGPAGSYYVWIGTTAVDGELGELTLTASEVEPAPGESCGNAIAIPATGTTAITTASTQRLDAPSCVSATSNVTWFRFTATERATVVRADVAGALAVYDRASATERACSPDAAARPLGAFVPVGREVCVAVPNDIGASSLTLEPVPYTGVLGETTPLDILRPVGSTGTEISISTSSWMAVTPTTLHMGVSSTGFLSVPRSGSARAEWHALASYEAGVSGVSVDEAIFGLEDTATGTGAPADRTRLYRLVTAAGGFPASPEDWDGATTYPTALVSYRALAYDGTDLWIANDYRASGPQVLVSFLRGSPSSAGLLTNEGTVSSFTKLVAMAVDDTWIFVMGTSGGTQGIFRLRRSDLATDPTPELVAAFTIPTSRGAVALDAKTGATLLYFRDAAGDVHVVGDPGGTPRELGVISALGRTSDHTFAYDPVARAIYLFETETVITGNFVRLD